MNNLERCGIGIMSLWGIFAVHQGVSALFAEHGWKGMGASDWAAWIQAIGSIGAIWGAFALARRQQREERALDLARKQAEAQRGLDAQLAQRTLAVKNVAQLSSYSLAAAGTLLTLARNDAAVWELDAYVTKIEQLRGILDSLISANTEHLAVITALEISEVLSLNNADLRNIGGSRRDDLINRCQVRIGLGYDLLSRLVGLQNKLVDTCRARGMPLEIQDFTPANQ